MKNMSYKLQIVVSDELEKHSRNFVDGFLKRAIIDPPLAVDLSFHPTHAEYRKDPKRSFAGPVYSEKNDEHFTIHMCEESLKDIPSLVLQGWLEHIMMRCIQKLQPEFYQINFRRNIFPLMPVTGAAENHILEMVTSLETGLKNHLATAMLIDLGLGLPQVYFCFFNLNPSMEDRDNYQETIPYSWTRTLFLCRKLSEFIPISLLAEKHVDFSNDLELYWWNAHDYLIREDQAILKILADIPGRYEKEPYSFKVIEMFKKVKSNLLAPPKRDLPSSTLH